MKYLVTFRVRYNEAGERGEDPTALVSPADGVVLDKEMAESDGPPHLNVVEDPKENANDDGFLTFGTENWVYEVADDRCDEFEHELRNSRVVLNYEQMEDEELISPMLEP
jgi:hypothetical protein